MKPLTLLPFLALLLNACVSTQKPLPPLSAGTANQVFVWHDLASTQPAASRTFYQHLFGWQFAKQDATYWLISDEGQTPLGGMLDSSKLNPGQQSSVWLCSIKVKNLADVVARVRANGGSILREPSPAPGRGQVALMADPAGAILQLVQPSSAQTSESTSPWIWHELVTANAEKSAGWYAEIFDLTVEKGLIGERYLLKKDGMLLASVSENPFEDTRNQWVPVLGVAHFDAVLKQIPGLGGQILIPPSPEKGDGNIALVLDPENAPLVLQRTGGVQ